MRNPIDDAIAALRRGEQAKAFALLRARLTQDPRDAAAWLWMSEATPDISRKVEALERFVVLAPDHPRVPSARARMLYLEHQMARSAGKPSAPVPSVIEPDATEPEPEPESTAPPVPALIPTREPEPGPRPRPMRAPAREQEPTPPSATPLYTESAPTPQRVVPPESSRYERREEPPAHVAPPAPKPDMTLQSSAPSRGYQPAMPDLLQSLLDTAPMPRVRTDLPFEPGYAPPRTDAPPTDTAADDEPVPAVEPIAAQQASATGLRATPWWAWAVLLLMAIQIALMLYLILRVEQLFATVL